MSTEASVGCRCFANDMPPMSGIIKHLYSDFHVNEIDQAGNVVHLTSLDPIELPEYPEGYEEWLASSQIFFSFTPTNDIQVARIYYEQPRISVTYSNSAVTLEKTSKPRVRPVITSFVLCKENLNQQDAIGRIAKRVQKPKKTIGFAGNKDKRGITTQICSIRDLPISRLSEATRNMDNGVRVGMFRPSIAPVSLGDLSGNRFTILLRDIHIPGVSDSDHEAIASEIANRIDALKTSGFLNYYGMQRFGTGPIPTHKIGSLVLQRKWREIIEILLRPNEGELEKLREAKVCYQKTRDCHQALKILPKSAQAEYALFEAMSRIPNPADHLKNPHDLFMRIDRRQRMMYVHAYQSYLWNHMLSARWERSGASVVLGDYVLDPETSEVVVVTEQNRHQYSVFDLVLPLPSGASLPEELNDLVKPLMEKDGVTLDMFDRLSREYGTGGVWRSIVGQAKDLEWEIIRHDQMDVPLIDSDLNRLDGTTNTTNHVKDGKIASLSLTFSLTSGQYATMCMRELLKRTTEWFTDSDMSNPKKGWFQWSGCSVQ